MGIIRASKNQIDFKRIFEMLNEELSSIERSLEIVFASGYAIQLHGYKRDS